MAHQYVAEKALVTGDTRRVGLELELHLVDLSFPGQRATWPQTRALAEGIGPLPSGSTVTLEPGDLIYTGTPGLTTPLKPGDVVEVEIEGIGVLRNGVTAEP